MSWLNYIGLALFSCVILSARAEVPHLNFAGGNSRRGYCGSLFQQMQKMRLLPKSESHKGVAFRESEEIYRGEPYRVRSLSHGEMALYNPRDEIIESAPFATIDISDPQPRLSDIQPTPGLSRKEVIDLCLQLIKKHCPDSYYAYGCDLDLNFEQVSCPKCSLVQYRLMSAVLEGTTPHLAQGGEPIAEERFTVTFDGTCPDKLSVNKGYKSAVMFLYSLPVQQLASDLEQLPWSDVNSASHELKNLCEKSGIDIYTATMGELAGRLYQQSSHSKQAHNRWHLFVKKFILFHNSCLARLSHWISQEGVKELEMALRWTFLYELNSYLETPSQILSWSQDVLNDEALLLPELKKEWVDLLEEAKWLSYKTSLFNAMKNALRSPPAPQAIEFDHIRHSKLFRSSEAIFDLHAKFFSLLSRSYGGQLMQTVPSKFSALEKINAMVRGKTAVEQCRQMGYFYVEAAKRTYEESGFDFDKIFGDENLENLETKLSRLIAQWKKSPEAMPIGSTTALWLLSKIAVQRETTFLYAIR